MTKYFDVDWASLAMGVAMLVILVTAVTYYSEPVEHTELGAVVGEPDVRLTVVQTEWGFSVDGKTGAITEEGSLKGGPVIRVKVGDVVEMTVTSEGKVAHGPFGVEPKEEGEDHQAAVGVHEEIEEHTGEERQGEHFAMTKLLQPGEVEVITFTAEEAGEYVYHCMTPGHTELGMTAAFIVEE